MSEQNGVGAGRIASQRLAQALRSAVATAFLGQPVVQRSTDDSLPLLDWGRRHLPEHFDKPPSPLHQWLGDQLDEVRARRGMKINVVGPRGAAKSTVATLAGVLRSALEGDERYLWIVSDTKGPGARPPGEREDRTGRESVASQCLSKVVRPWAAVASGRHRAPERRRHRSLRDRTTDSRTSASGESADAHRLRRLAERSPHRLGPATRDVE